MNLKGPLNEQRRIFWHLMAFPLLAAATLCFGALIAQAAESCVPYDDVSQFVCRFGKPDIDDSTENDRPRPPIVTRKLIYEKERVRAVYVPDARISDPPPYRRWKFIGFQDPDTNVVLSAQEVVRRMQARDTKK